MKKIMAIIILATIVTCNAFAAEVCEIVAQNHIDGVADSVRVLCTDKSITQQMDAQKLFWSSAYSVGLKSNQDIFEKIILDAGYRRVLPIAYGTFLKD